jgi:Protein of unknown function (DUF2561)
MLENTELAPTRRTLSGPPNLERILFGLCAVIWLAALGAAVSAAVALVDLAGGRGAVRAELSEASGSDTPWALYTVIGISAVVIAVAIPLLIRARQQSSYRPTRTNTPAGGSVADAIGAVPTRESRRRHAEPAIDTGVRSAALPTLIDQVYVRCATAIACAVGAGTLAVGVATYLIATDNGTAAVSFYIVAGIVILVMPVLPWFYLRELHGVIGDAHGR